MAADLDQIRVKIRRLVKSPSAAQITDNELNEYINTFILYDFPEHLRLFTYRTILSFYTEPYIDTYETNTTDPADPMYNFKNAYITSHDPVFIAGNRAYFTQSRSDFYAQYPYPSSKTRVATGNGIATVFGFTLSAKPVLRGQVVFSSVATGNTGVAVSDKYSDGNLYDTVTGAGAGIINYVTGACIGVTFSSAPAANQPIYAQTVPYVAARPNSILYYDNKFIVRPVPELPYKIELETYIRPTALVNSSDQPLLEQNWQYIAYGAAKKILEDRMDIDTVQDIMPEFKQQEILCLRRTIVQQSNERVATIYTNQTDVGGSGWGWNNF